MGNRGGGLLHGYRLRWLPILASRLRGGSGSSARATRRRGELNSGATGTSGSPSLLVYGGGWSSGGELWWGRRPGVVVDGSQCGKVVQGGAVLVARWRQNKAALHGGSTASEQGGAVGATGGRKAVHGGEGGGWALFIAGRGSGWRRRGGESGGGEMTTGNQRCQRCCGSDRLPMVCASERQLSGRWARSILSGWVGTVDMSWVQSGAQPFSNYSNFAPNFQIQNEDYPDVHKCSNLAWC
jgi:hypothetical protein